MDCGELDEAEIGLGELVVSGGNAAELFEFCEEPLDAGAGRVKVFVIAMLVPAGAPRWDHRLPPLLKDEIVEAIGIIGPVGQHRTGLEALDQGVSGGDVVLLTRTERQTNGQPQRVRHGMEFCAKTPA